MFSFFGLFGRSREQQRLDHALRDAGIHPRLVPEAIKLTTLKLLKESGEQAADHECAAAAEILVYCLLGPGVYAEQNGGIRTDAAEARIEAAIVAEHSLDARLVLLTLHAGLTQSEVIERFGLRSD